MRHDVASRATLVFLFFCGFPRFSGLLNVFLRYHSTPLWQDPAKYGKSEKHPDERAQVRYGSTRVAIMHGVRWNLQRSNINESTLFMQFMKDGV
ncbi:MAG TPA: hypothetical protein OIL96_09005 [Bifidobacteriaceae bacterium]|nr:hypothetical protein [Bifidobacteriaceae bacterium]